MLSFSFVHAIQRENSFVQRAESLMNEYGGMRMYVRYVPFRCFGQHTNSTPENKDIPQGSSIAKLLRFMFLSLQVSAAVVFHLKQTFPSYSTRFMNVSVTIPSGSVGR